GYKPSDITDIVLTHLHLVHIGWASVDGKSTFPNAKYHLPQSEWDYWVAKPEGNNHSKAVLDITQAVMKPVAPQLQAFSGESETLFPGFKIRHAPGHTPGTVIVELDSGGRKALILGDTAHSAMSLQDKTWPGNFDLDEAQTLAAKNALIDEAVATHAQVSAAHISGMRFGQIVETKDRGLLFFFNEK
ncbi:MAG: MBL fold metallo-hydrolase, partial [Phenylobacterium sp.]